MIIPNWIYLSPQELATAALAVALEEIGEECAKRAAEVILLARMGGDE